MTEIQRCETCGLGDGRAGAARPSRSRVYGVTYQVLDGIMHQIIFLTDPIVGQYLANLDDVTSRAFRAENFHIARWADARIVDFAARDVEQLPATPKAG